MTLPANDEWPAPIPCEMSLTKFLTWDAPGPYRWQLVEGVPEPMAPSTNAHARIHAILAWLIQTHLDRTRPGYFVLSNAGVRLSEDDQRNFRIPDLGVSRTPQKPSALYIENPILLIEILSAANAKETWLNVQAFTHIACLEEILIFDSTKMAAENWRRFRDGTWHRKKFRYATEDVQFFALQHSIRLQEIYAGTGLEAAE